MSPMSPLCYLFYQFNIWRCMPYLESDRNTFIGDAFCSFLCTFNACNIERHRLFTIYMFAGLYGSLKNSG